MKVLVVDDNVDQLYLTEIMLKKIGYETITAENGSIALDILNKEKIDMIVSDILMPVLDGFQFCMSVRKEEKYDDIIFVLFSATYTEEEDKNLSYKVGADKYIAKPIAPDDFLDIIQDLVKNFKSKERKCVEDEGEKEVLKLYNERLVKKLEKRNLQLKQNEKKILKLQEIKNEIITRVSHELKTPLVSIRGYSEYLLGNYSEKIDDDILSLIKPISRGYDRLESLIQNMIKTIYLDSKTVQLNLERGNLSSLLEECVSRYTPLAKLRGNSVIFEIDSELFLDFDYDMIQQAFENLIINAINYTPPNGKIIIKANKKEKDLKISIKDTGIGLTEEEILQLFKKFGKIERYGKDMDVYSEGIGFGLYISRKSIELHGGKIWVESEGKNKGSTFYFTIPIIREKELIENLI